MMARYMILVLLFLGQTSWANVQEAKDDLAWTDIGDSIIKVEEEKRVQRDYNSISKNEGLLSVGAFLSLSRDINLRTSPQGEKIKPVYKGQVYQVLEVQVNGAKRFYKIKDAQDIGFIYAGTKASYAKWVKQTWSTDHKVLPQVGDHIRIKRKRGLKISKSIDEESFSKIPRGVQAQVQSITQNESGEIFYKLKYKSKAGYAKIGSSSQLALAPKWSEVR